jgi:hypothetical protein
MVLDNILNDAQAHYLDTNSNGRLDADELMAFEKSRLSRAIVDAAAHPDVKHELIGLDLRDVTPAILARNYKTFARQSAQFFPCGVEALSRDQLVQLTSLSHETGRRIRDVIRHSNYWTEIRASSDEWVDDMSDWASLGKIMLVDTISSPPRSTCPSWVDKNRPRTGFSPSHR